MKFLFFCKFEIESKKYYLNEANIKDSIYQRFR